MSELALAMLLAFLLLLAALGAHLARAGILTVKRPPKPPAPKDNT
jgi:hypothetical protein